MGFWVLFTSIITICICAVSLNFQNCIENPLTILSVFQGTVWSEVYEINFNLRMKPQD